MKTSIINPFARLGVASTPGWVLPALIAVLNLLPAGRVTAQTFTTLHSFTDDTDGASPYAGLITNSSGNTLYGMAANAGSWSAGTVFAVHTDGTGFTNLYSFSEGAQDPSSGDYTNSDGAGPFAQLILSGNTLYGTARYGGSGSVGTVFAANTDGTGFTNLHSFTAFLFPPVNTNSDGAYPGGLILSGNTLYGTAGGGGSSDNGNGTLFAINTDGSGFTNLHNFSATSTNASGVYTNSDGIYPNDKLVVSGNTLYGTAGQGGGSGNGTVFAVNTDGSGFTTLHSFTALPAPYYTNSDGNHPNAGLILSGNTLYGTAQYGGSSFGGTVFALNTAGTGFTNLHSFSRGAQDPSSGDYTNSDGIDPHGSLILAGNTLYGTAYDGGSSGNGTVFAVNTDGTGFTTLHSFSATPPPYYTNSDGASPYAGLVLSGNTLYGTATFGGSSAYYGTVFSLSFRPQLTLTRSGTNVILSWPTNVAGFDYTGYTLQSTTNMVSPAVWSSNSLAPVVISGQNTVTNPIAVAQKFYRLSQ